MINIPIMICMFSGLFYGTIWVLNKDLIWQTPQHMYASYQDWFAANNPKGLWYAPLIGALLWPHHHQKVSFNPVSDFLWDRILLTFAAIIVGLVIGKWVASNRVT